MMLRTANREFFSLYSRHLRVANHATVKLYATNPAMANAWYIRSFAEAFPKNRAAIRSLRHEMRAETACTHDCVLWPLQMWHCIDSSQPRSPHDSYSAGNSRTFQSRHSVKGRITLHFSSYIQCGGSCSAN